MSTTGIGATAMCVCCLKRKALTNCGHVVLPGGRKITAGWCRRCIKAPGFVGHWLPAMNPTTPQATEGKTKP